MALDRDQTDFLDGDIDGYFERTSVEETTSHGALRGIPLGELAAERGEHPLDVMLDLALEDGLDTRFRNLPRCTKAELTRPRDRPPHGPRRPRRRRARRHAVRLLLPELHPALLGARRGRPHARGSHLAHVRASRPRSVGIPDRGVIAPGKVADIVAFDPDTHRETTVRAGVRLPGRRRPPHLAQRGIEHVWVAGVATRRDGVDVEGADPRSSCLMTAVATIVDEIPIIDSDTHVIEPADLWTSRLSTKRWGNLIPHVRWDDETQERLYGIHENC